MPDLPDDAAFDEELLEPAVERPSVQEGLLNHVVQESKLFSPFVNVAASLAWEE